MSIQQQQYIQQRNIEPCTSTSSTSITAPVNERLLKYRDPMAHAAMIQAKKETEASRKEIDKKSPLFKLLLATNGNPEYNRNHGEDILEMLYDFSLDCYF